MPIYQEIKDPDDVAKWTIPWYLSLGGDTISTSTWSIAGNESPLSLAVDSDSIGDYTGQSPILTNTTAIVVVSGGTMGIRYQATNHIVTAAGLEYDATILVEMHQN